MKKSLIYTTGSSKSSYWTTHALQCLFSRLGDHETTSALTYDRFKYNLSYHAAGNAWIQEQQLVHSIISYLRLNSVPLLVNTSMIVEAGPRTVHHSWLGHKQPDVYRNRWLDDRIMKNAWNQPSSVVLVRINLHLQLLRVRRTPEFSASSAALVIDAKWWTSALHIPTCATVIRGRKRKFIFSSLTESYNRVYLVK